MMQDFNNPSRADYYAMRICQRIDAVLGRALPIESYKVEKTFQRQELDIEGATERSLQRIKARGGER